MKCQLRHHHQLWLDFHLYPLLKGPPSYVQQDCVGQQDCVRQTSAAKFVQIISIPYPRWQPGPPSWKSLFSTSSQTTSWTSIYVFFSGIIGKISWNLFGSFLNGYLPCKEGFISSCMNSYVIGFWFTSCVWFTDSESDKNKQTGPWELPCWKVKSHYILLPAGKIKQLNLFCEKKKIMTFVVT